MYYLNQKMMKVFCAFSVSMLFSHFSYASIVIDGTRVIYQGSKSEVTVNLTNKNKKPVLIQSWIDTGNESLSPERISVPFVLSPPINRVDPGNGQTIRISYTGVPALPTNRESVVWLNVLEIPAKDKITDSTQQQLNIAFRTRIKLFYRPEGLQGNSDQAPEALHWHFNGDSVSVQNPSSYVVTIFTVDYKDKGISSSVKGDMLLPGGTKNFRLKNTGSMSSLSFSAINDYGVPVIYKAKS